MKHKEIKKAFKLANDILRDTKDIKPSIHYTFCNYRGICIKDTCKGCKYLIKKHK